MFIKSLLIKNFLSFGDKGISVEGLKNYNVFVGPNNSGKSNVLRTISFIKKYVGQYIGADEIDIAPYLHNSDNSLNVDIQITIKMDENERNVLSSVLLGTSISQFNVGNVFRQKDAGLDNKQIERMHLIMASNQIDVMNDLFSEFTLHFETKGISAQRPVFYMEFKSGADSIIAEGHNFTLCHKLSSSNYHYNFADTLFEILKDLNQEEFELAISGKKADLSEEIEDVKLTPNAMMKFFKGGEDNHNKAITFNFGNFQGHGQDQYAELDNFSKTYIDFLTRYGWDGPATPWTILYLLMKNSVIEMGANRSDFKDVEPTSILALFGPQVSVINGRTIGGLLFRLKNSTNTAERRSFQLISKEFERLSEGLVFDVSLTSDKVQRTSIKMVQHQVDELAGFGSLRVNQGETYLPGFEKAVEEHEVLVPTIYIYENEIPVPLEFSSNGLFEILATITAVSLPNLSVSLIDEPSINLHPKKQVALSHWVEAYAMQDMSKQWLFVSHSPYFAKLGKHTMTYMLNKESGSSSELINISDEFSVLSGDVQKKAMIEFESYDKLSILFAKGVVLVEGPSDRIVIQEIDRFLNTKQQGAGISENDWVLVEMGTKDKLTMYLSLLRSLKLPFIAIVDRDALMYIVGERNYMNNRIKLSRVFDALFQNDLLSDEEILTIRNVTSNKLLSGNQLTYSEDNFAIMNKICRQHSVFVLNKDLEAAGEYVINKGESKTVLALSKVTEWIKGGEIPSGILEIISYIKGGINEKGE